MEEISLRNEEPQKNNGNVFVSSNRSIFRIKLFNILLGSFLIVFGVGILTGVLLYIKLNTFRHRNHALGDGILSIIYIIVASWVSARITLILETAYMGLRSQIVKKHKKLTKF